MSILSLQPFLKQYWRHNELFSCFKSKKNKTFPCVIKSWSAAPGRLRHRLKLWEKMKNRSCIINKAFCESVKVHLTQTPVWNAFWVTCRLALMSVNLNSSKDRTLADLSWQIYGLLMSSPFTRCILAAFVLTVLECRLWFCRLHRDKSSNPDATSSWLMSLGWSDKAAVSGGRGQPTPGGNGVKFRETF